MKCPSAKIGAVEAGEKTFFEVEKHNFTFIVGEATIQGHEDFRRDPRESTLMHIAYFDTIVVRVPQIYDKFVLWPHPSSELSGINDALPTLEDLRLA